MRTLLALNLSAAVLHYSLALGLGAYFNHTNNKYGNQPVQGVELTMRDHALVTTDYIGNCVVGPNTICDSNDNGAKFGWESKITSTPPIQTLQKMLILFFIITGTFHLAYFIGDLNPDGDNWATNGYSKLIKGGNNYLRWIEYSVTSTLMIYVIAFISGVKDTNIYYMLYATNIAMISQGQLIEEKVRDGKDPWIPMITSFMLLIAEWTVIIRSFSQRISQVNTFLTAHQSGPISGVTKGEIIPSWITYMILILAMFFSCFGFVSLIGSYMGTQYETIEKAYIILSFVAKATLGFFVAYSMGQRQAGWQSKIPTPTPTPTPTPHP